MDTVPIRHLTCDTVPWWRRAGAEPRFFTRRDEACQFRVSSLPDFFRAQSASDSTTWTASGAIFTTPRGPFSELGGMGGSGGGGGSGQDDFWSVAKHLTAGGVAGAVSRTVVSPLERMKILFQVRVCDGGHASALIWCRGARSNPLREPSTRQCGERWPRLAVRRAWLDSSRVTAPTSCASRRILLCSLRRTSATKRCA